MKAIKRHDLLDKFPTKKRPKGAKRAWYLEDNEVLAVVKGIQEPDTLLLFYLGITSGGRVSSLIKVRPEQILYEQKVINMYEPKRKEYVPRFFQPETLNLLRQYIIDFGFKGNEKIFRWSEATYNDRLKKAGERVGLTKKVTTHIMKHTFVSQASKRGVSLDTVSEQTGTEPQTLKDYYMAINIKKMRAELLGEKYEVEPFGAWVKSLHPYFEKRYRELRDKAVLVNGIRLIEKPKAKKKPKPKKARKINWDAIKKMIQTYEALPEEKKKLVPQRHVIPFWKKALKYHKQGYSDAEAIKRAKYKNRGR
jgi:hypothetical protein